LSFASLTFLIFFVVVYGIMLLFDVKPLNKLLPAKTQLTLKHIILVIASYFFYGWWDYRFCFLMFSLSLIAWFCAKMADDNKMRKLCAVIGVVVPLLTLGFFKYYNFFVDSFSRAFGITSTGSLNIILPVGISFYTFQSMSYTIDVLRGKYKHCTLLETLLYVSFFPQLVAGPIVKASEFMPQLKANMSLKLSNLSAGLQIFAFGLIKKLVIADNLSLFVDDYFAQPLAFSSLTAVLAVISYSIQIYCDFSGYSDMAIGVAKCFGYDFCPNFNIPYISKNVSEFWKRWHISLSSWLQEYLYIPLGGNRKGTVRTYINLLATMVLGGLWHGANYTFVVWGLLHGLALCVHKLYASKRKSKTGTSLGTVASILLTYCFVCICWVFFRAPTFSVAMDVLSRLFIWKRGITQIFVPALFGIVLLLVSTLFAVLKSKQAGEKRVNGFYLILDLSKFSSLVIMFVVVMLIVALAYTNANPFIYFQF
jgi:alginate O-acetyltransferase complex protein AlgI